MENQTRFDLNAAIENWRQELAAQPNLASDDRRELETHLRDAVAGFQQRGLNDEESFWLARHRVGQPQQLGEEFVKADPIAVWRERAFWFVVVILLIQLWSQTVLFFWFLFRDYLFWRLVDWLPSDAARLLPTFYSESISGLLPLFSFMFVVGFAIVASRKRLKQRVEKFQFPFKSRFRFLLAFAVFFSAYFLLLFNFAVRSNSKEMLFSAPIKIIVSIGFEYALFPILLVGLIAWLMPTRKRKTPKRA
jgi:hypothetical protein